MRTACVVAGCPGYAVERGRCARHRRTTAQRGYGIEHRRERAAALPGARCEACGSTRGLQRDHVVPVSLGGSQARENKRWLCAACHARHGLRSDGRGGRVVSRPVPTPQETRAPLREGNSGASR
jgi:5-methylcytosine-specific restriction endonuclease McrA